MGMGSGEIWQELDLIAYAVTERASGGLPLAVSRMLRVEFLETIYI